MRKNIKLLPGFNKSTIKDRNWSDGMITKFLGEPDFYRKNRNYPGGPDLVFYHEARVIEVEATDEFKNAQAKYLAKKDKMKDGARKGVKTKRDNLLLKAIAFKPIIPVLDYDELMSRAFEHNKALREKRMLNYYKQERDFDNGRDYIVIEEKIQESEEEFSIRIMGNYVRHQLTNYDYKLKEFEGKHGKEDAYYLAKKKVLEAIVETYPFLHSILDKFLGQHGDTIEEIMQKLSSEESR